MRLSKILERVREKKSLLDDVWKKEAHSLSADGRTCKKGALFFCLTGGKTDGHRYVEQAERAGAVALVVEREVKSSLPQILVPDTRLALGLAAACFYGEPSSQMQVVGVTGTNGKTTVTYMLESIFREHGKRTGVIGTTGIRYGGREYPNDLTTPDPVELQEVLAQMLREGVEYVFMEVSAHALYYKKTAGVRFAACIFTNLSQDHLDFFSSMQAYGEEKAKLFEGAVCPLAVLNGDEKWGRILGERRRKEEKTLYYGLNTPADAFAILTDESLLRTECMLNLSDELCRVSLSMGGRHNVYNALAAASCAFALGVPARAIARGVTTFKGVKGRLQRVASFKGGEIFVDFAHTPDGLQKSLEALKPHCKGRLLCLFGCGGNRDRAKRALMGEIAAKLTAFTVLTSDNPRYEDPMDILCEIERGYRRFSSRYVIVPDRERAIEYALEFLAKGDVLLIAGKGGEETQEIMGIKHPFNDQDKVIKLLEKKERRV